MDILPQTERNSPTVVASFIWTLCITVFNSHQHTQNEQILFNFFKLSRVLQSDLRPNTTPLSNTVECGVHNETRLCATGREAMDIYSHHYSFTDNVSL